MKQRAAKRKDEGGRTLGDFDAANERHDRLVAAREERARLREAGSGVQRLEPSTD